MQFAEQYFGLLKTSPKRHFCSTVFQWFRRVNFPLLSRVVRTGMLITLTAKVKKEEDV